MMLFGKLNIGKGLLRLYLVFWMLLVIASLVGSLREVMTYLGSTHWSVEKVVQRQEEEFQRKNKDCTTKECQKMSAIDLAPAADKVVDPEKAKASVELAVILVLAVPAALLLVLIMIFKLLAWAFAGFKTN
jgi:preprotein translocase subunit SecF